MTAGCVVTFGEVMLRLTPPGHERLLQSPVLQADAFGVLPTMLIVLMTILAILGIVAHAAVL